MNVAPKLQHAYNERSGVCCGLAALGSLGNGIEGKDIAVSQLIHYDVMHRLIIHRDRNDRTSISLEAPSESIGVHADALEAGNEA